MERSIQYKLNSLAIILLFSASVFVPFFWGLFEKDKAVSKIEKRPLSRFPEIETSIDSVKTFPRRFDTYYADHFGLREWLVKYYKSVKFKLADSPSGDVTLGKNGWLFLGSVKKDYKKYNDPIGDARNANLFSDNDLRRTVRQIAAVNAWLNQWGIKYIFVIAPNKHTIYFENLPDYISKTNEYSSTDQLVDYLENHTDVRVVDLREKLIKSKDKGELYYKTDTHWNSLGANIAQYEIMLAIEKLFPDLIEPELFKMRDGFRKGGDLAGFIGVSDFKESNPMPIFEHLCKPLRSPENTNPREPHSYSCEGQKLNALIYRDSFFTALQPYFSRKFNRSTYIWKRLRMASLKKYIELEKPDIVIEEWVERALPIVHQNAPKPDNRVNKQKFNSSAKSIFSNSFKDLKYSPHAQLLKNTGSCLKIKSTGRDPIIFFPPLFIKQRAQYIMHIEIESSIQSILQVFYSDAETPKPYFSEKNSVRLAISQGENNIYLALNYEKMGKRLRLDPISGTGTVVIKALEIREIDRLR